ncbi:hypothetical protein B0H14DRAFT_3860041 [Mycena olivaceomarginata]|nr:hypothetical protein B0H14DRAFT_3860041 [Mycena olivaceomarginata]
MSSNALLAQTIHSLRDPKNPKFCCRYYICLLSQIEIEHAHNWENPITRHAPYDSDSDKLQLELSSVADSTSLLDSLSNFITTNRSRPNMAVLARRMGHCECDRNDRLIDSMHAWEWNLTAYCRDPDGFLCRTDTLEGLLAVIADLLYNALQLHDHRSLRWPQNRRQCLVGSDEGAATMLCRWLDVYPILPLLRAIAATAASFGSAVLVPFLLSAHLPKNLVGILKRGVDSLPPDFGGGFDAFGVVYPITLVFTTMKELGNIDDGVSSAYFYREWCPLLLDTMNRVAEINEKMAWLSDFTWEGGFNLAGVIHAKLVLPFDEAQYHKKILEYSQLCRTLILSVQKPHELARNIMLTLAALPLQCMNAKCAKPDPASLCSGCRRVMYCNTECQSSDWNGPLPHKKVCKEIRALGDAVGFPARADPNPILPQRDVHEFRLAVQYAVPLSDVKAFNKYMIEDDRIRKVVNDKYSARYPRSLD